MSVGVCMVVLLVAFTVIGYFYIQKKNAIPVTLVSMPKISSIEFWSWIPPKDSASRKFFNTSTCNFHKEYRMSYQCPPWPSHLSTTTNTPPESTSMICNSNSPSRSTMTATMALCNPSPIKNNKRNNKKL